MAPPSDLDKDYLLCTSWHFLVKKPSWPAKQWILGPLFYIFSKKFSASLHSAWILLFFPILLVSLCSLFIHISCAYFCIIMTQAITFLACKDWSEVFSHTLLDKKCLRINKYFYIKFFWNFKKKVLRIVGRYIFWSLKCNSFLGPK